MSARSNVVTAGLTAACLAAVIATMAVAQAPAADTTLTAAQREMYARHHLSVQVTERASGAIGLHQTTVWTTLEWTAYEGYRPLTEAEFFARLGMTDEARQAAARHRDYERYSRLGLGLLLPGAVLAVAAMHPASLDAADNKALIAGGVGAGVAGVILMVKASHCSGNWAPYATVESLVDGYNARLRTRILGGENLGAQPVVRPAPRRVLVGLALPLP